MRRLMIVITIASTMILQPFSHVAAKEVMIHYDNQFELASIMTILQQNADVLEEVNLISATITPQQVAKLHKLPFGHTIEEDKQTNLQSNSRELLAQIAQVSPVWNVNVMKAQTAWKLGITGEAVKIAVIDTGINKVEELAKVKGSISFSPDDPTTKSINESDLIDRGKEGSGHGTAVASVIAAQPNGFFIGRSPVVGLAPNASIYSVKYMDGSASTGKASNIVKSINWAIANKMDIINISSGLQTDYPALKQAINQAVDKGIFIVASAGNNGLNTNLTYPARYTNVIGVGSINKSLYFSSFSNSGATLDFTAPGEKIPAINKDGSLVYAYGTSFSAPHITGLLALLKQRYPFSTNKMIVEKLKKSVIDLGSNGRDKVYGFGVPTFISTSPKIIEASPTLKVQKITDHSVKLTVNKSNVYKDWRTVITLNNRTHYYTKKQTILIPKLQAHKTHHLAVRYMSDDEDVSQPSTVSFKTLRDTTSPQIPTNVQGVISNKNVVQLKWKKPVDLDFSHMLIYENNRYIGKTVNTKFISTTVLKKKIHYQYKLIAVDEEGNRSKATQIKVIRLR
ncbi:S8 family peptidase [Kurthia sibirica]|uniref:Peptidase S8/S53 domain-containing protein n=1 Tax=Kurthia sibirica TaxID=202750 RepID=A0A2U3AN03_9BACL|nr:S8 family serine peptidase [Kurthia sibirica]PWI25923.1 hypothetical protein DEX24_05165 [Kurthia sibirica]GEK34279.1 hypothetical protein KSI01_18120 [Kurthia sibirica]